MKIFCECSSEQFSILKLDNIEFVQDNKSDCIYQLSLASDINMSLIDIEYFIEAVIDKDFSYAKYLYFDGNKGSFYLDEKYNIKDIDGSYNDGLHELNIQLSKIKSTDTDPKGIVGPKSKIDRSGVRIKALFLDRDGIINVDTNYVHKMSEVEIYPGFIETAKYFQSKGYSLFVLTNQSGVAREKFGTSEVELLHKEMDQYLKDKGVNISSWEYCPYHDVQNNNQFSKKSILRKPDGGMLFNCFNKNFIDIKNSLIIGDRPSDVLNVPLLRAFNLRRHHCLEKTKAECVFDSYEQLIIELKTKY